MKIISLINLNLCSIKRFKGAKRPKVVVFNMTLNSYLIPRQPQISKTKW